MADAVLHGPKTATLADQIDAILPQTQCTQCGYEGCRPYAEALATGNEAINRCPPGGDAGITALARLLDQPAVPLDPDCGTHTALMLAVIDEDHCIGCTLCLQACPVDAIVGANKKMHTVVPDLCTGCKLCIPPCPVDCIQMTPAGYDWTPQHAATARERHNQRQTRLKRKHPESQSLAARTLSNKAALTSAAESDAQARQVAIAQALARARERRRQSS